MNRAVVTEQTTEAFDLKLIGFILRGSNQLNFSHSIAMVWAMLLCTFKPNIGNIEWKLREAIWFEKWTDGRMTDRSASVRSRASNIDNLIDNVWHQAISCTRSILFSTRHLGTNCTEPVSKYTDVHSGEAFQNIVCKMPPILVWCILKYQTDLHLNKTVCVPIFLKTSSYLSVSKPSIMGAEILCIPPFLDSLTLHIITSLVWTVESTIFQSYTLLIDIKLQHRKGRFVIDKQFYTMPCDIGAPVGDIN